MKEELYRFLQPLRRRISLLIGRALLVAVDDSKNLQLLRISMLSGEEKEGVERMQQYGFTSVPVSGSEVLIGAINGSKDQVIAIVVNDSRARMKNLSEGDVAIHRQSTDNVWIKLLSNDTIEVHAKNVNVNLESGGKVDIAGNLTIDSGLGLGVKKLITEDILTVLNAHIHTCATPGSPSGPAMAPGPNPFTSALHATTKTKAD